MTDARPLTPGETDLARSMFGEAIDYAIDKQAIVDTVTFGIGEVADVAIEADREVEVLHLDPFSTGEVPADQRELGADDFRNLDGGEQARHRLHSL